MVAQWSRTQPIIAMSSCEAELLALNEGAREAKLVQGLLGELHVKLPVRVYTDSGSARLMAYRRGPGRMKHIELRQLWLQEQVRSKMFEIEKIPTEQNLADVLTKPLGKERLEYFRPRLGLEDLSQ
jgi:hypothetical protein